jgi:hypothetical protein
MVNFRALLFSAVIGSSVIVGPGDAFTPDFAFKMKQAALFAKEQDDKSSVASGNHNVVIRRIPDLDLYRDQKSRRSVTFPPSFGDYMAVRKRSEQYNQNKFWQQNHLDPF